MGGGGPTQSSSGWSSSTTNPVLYKYSDILPPWTMAAQQRLLPYLTQRAFQGGMTAGEKSSLWREAMDQVGAATDTARRGVLQSLASSGVSPSSPAGVSLLGDVENQRLASTQKAALDFAKLKLGAKDTAINQLMTGAYANVPFGIGYSSQSYGQQRGSAGGGK